MGERMNKEQAKLDKVYDECIEQIGDGDEVDTATAIDCLCEIWNAWNDYTKQDEWVDVNDRLPDKKGIYYLCTIEFLINGVKTISVNRLMFLTNNNFETWHDKMRVLAWKPLPEPYERKE